MSASRAALVLGAVSACLAAVPARALAAAPISRRMYGVTVDHVGRLDAVVAALRALPRRPTIRVVFDVDAARPTDATAYRRPVARLAAVGPVLGELVDSSDLRRLGVRQVAARARAYVRALGSRVAIWEIGNEVNGSWTGRPSTVAAGVRAAYATVRSAGGRTALTLFENEGCGDGPDELTPAVWSRRHLDARTRAGLDYVLLSYYEPECGYRRPSAATWTRRFARLHRLFPHAWLGFGEIGLPNPATDATRSLAASVIDHYYGLRIRLPYYVGGGFYWYFAEDMVPWRSSSLWSELARAWRGTVA